MSGARATLRRWAVPAVLLLASCSGGGAEPVAASEPAAPPPARTSESPAAQDAEPPPEQRSEQVHAQLARDVTDARIAAYEARAAALGLRDEDARGPALAATHSGRALLNLMYATLLDDVFAYDLDDLTVDVQSVAIVDEATAIVETCATYELRQRRVNDGKVVDPLDRNGPITRQSTDEMVLTDGAWKLHYSVVNMEEFDDVECPLTSERGRAISEDQVGRRRARAEAAYVDAVRAHDAGRLDEHFTGDLHTRVAIDPMSSEGRISVDEHCPRYPPTVDRGDVSDPRPWIFADEVPDVFDRHWREIYDKPPPESEDMIIGRDAEGRPNRFTSPRYVTRCMNEYLYGASYVYPAWTGDSDSTVAVLDVIFPTDDPPKVVYLDVCRVQDLRRDGGPNDAISGAVIRSRESLRLDGGRWKLATRWNVSLTEDMSTGCGSQPGGSGSQR